MKNYLMMIHIGPVQDFIASARKLRDLWYGSYLLSELSKKVAQELYKKNAGLIFPYPENSEKDLHEESDMNVGNKVLATIQSESPKLFFQDIKTELIKFWREISKETIKRDKEYIDHKLFDIQINEFPEIYGAWVLMEDEIDYNNARKEVESLLAARKCLRNFGQVDLSFFNDHGGLPKSSLDGVRESILHPDFRLSQGDRKKKGIKKYEELDALGWVKRYGTDSQDRLPHFESFSDLAIDPFYRGILKNKSIWDKLNKLHTLITENIPNDELSKIDSKYSDAPLKNIGPGILFKSRFNADHATDDSPISQPKIKEITRHLQSIYKKAGGEPLPYASIIIGDGDWMGKSLSNLTEKKDHQRFSEALNKFAKGTKEVVDVKNKGRLIYSGGDDVLAFAPLDTTFQCAADLQKLFVETMTPVFPNNGSPTFSIGIAIVHHIQPMGFSIEMARSAERMAKDNGRNSLAVILAKRSGNPVEICQSWNSKFVERLDEWITCHREDLLPDKFAYELKRLSKILGDELTFKDELPHSMQDYEFLRILNRKKAHGGKNELDTQEINKIIAAASSLNSLNDLANELIITKIVAQSQDQAEGK